MKWLIFQGGDVFIDTSVSSQSVPVVCDLQAYLHVLKLNKAIAPCNHAMKTFVLQDHSHTTCSLKVHERLLLYIILQLVISVASLTAMQLCVCVSYC